MQSTVSLLSIGHAAPIRRPLSWWHRMTTGSLLCVMLHTAARGLGVQAELEWSWSYQAEGISAGGTLYTERTTDIEGYYTITSITGERNGIPIAELTEIGVPVPGNEPFNVDNAIREATDDDPAHLRSAGIGLKLEDGTYLNPYYASWRDPPTYLEIYSAEPFAFGLNMSGPEDHELPVTFTAAVVPPVPTMEWEWSYEGDNITASGTLYTETTADNEGFYVIKSIDGERNGIAITELTEPGIPVPGNEPYSVDNALKMGTEDDPSQLRSAGIGMRLEDGVYLNPFYASWRDPPIYLEIYSAEPFIFGFNNSGPEDHELPVNFTATIVKTIEWTWKYEGEGFSASGTLHTKEISDEEGFYTITSISGERNGVKIVELTEVGVPVPGNEPYDVDNAIRIATDDNPQQLRSAGIGMRLEDGTYLNPFFAAWREPPTHVELYSALPYVFGFNNSGVEDHELEIAFSATPIDPDASDSPVEETQPPTETEVDDPTESSQSAGRRSAFGTVVSALIIFVFLSL